LYKNYHYLGVPSISNK